MGVGCRDGRHLVLIAATRGCASQWRPPVGAAMTVIVFSVSGSLGWGNKPSVHKN